MAIKGKCSNPDCTVVDTGTCFLLKDPSSCEYFSSDLAVADEKKIDDAPGQKEHASKTLVQELHSGRELGTEEIGTLSRRAYLNVIGILGKTDAGKTSLIVALYLMALHGLLRPQFAFAGSLTLRALEERTRHLRRWPEGQPLNKLTDRTLLADPRQPAFLHLSLSAANEQKELVLSDLPGEWTEALVSSNDAAERFRFLERADAVVLAIDGPALANGRERHVELQNLKYLIDRLAQNFSIDREVPFVLYATKCDLLQMTLPTAVTELSEYASNQGLTPHIVTAASFSTRTDLAPHGKGVLDLLQILFPGQLPPPQRNDAPLIRAGRSFYRSLAASDGG